MPDSELSFSAQSVLDAINKELDEAPWDVSFLAGVSAAAALRAAALICTRERRTLVAIADELEGIKYGTYRCDLEDKPQ